MLKVTLKEPDRLVAQSEGNRGVSRSSQDR